MAKITKTQRWLDLIAYLSGRRYPVSRRDLLHLPAYAGLSLDSATRTFERDLHELRQAGIQIDAIRESAGGNEERDGYVLRTGDFSLPYLRMLREGQPAEVKGVTTPGTIRLTPDEAAAALESLQRAARIPASPLADAARRAHAKLALDLDPETFPGAPVVYAEPPGGSEPADLLSMLSDAVLQRDRVRFRYHGIRRGEETDRRVAPYGLMRVGGSWYLVGHDESRGAIREFRVSRMEGLLVEGGSFEVPEDFRLEERLGREAWELGDEPPETVRVRFSEPLDVWAERNGRGEAAGDAPCVRAFAVRQRGPFLRWILSMAGDAEIIEPAEVRAAAAMLARQTADRYRNPDPDA